MNLLAQVVGFIGIIVNIIGIQLKKKKDIMVAFLLASIIFAINFALLKAYCGAVISIVMAIEIFINHKYDKKKKAYPIWLIFLYILSSITLGLFTYRNLFDILPIVSSIIFIFTIIQKKEKNIRLLTLIFITLFLVYDFLVGAYFAMFSDTMHDISTVIAIIRYDVFSKKSKRKRKK